MSNVIQLPVIAGVEITTDEHGRFNLNALHRASGGEKKNGPSYWLALDGTKDLIVELEKQNTEIPVLNQTRGRSGGTFAHEVLAVEYAGWISAAFRIQVNQTFLDYRTGKLAPAANPSDLTRMDILQIAMAAERERQIAELERDEAVKTKAEIGSKREATAMATASAQKRRANKLQEQLGISENWKQAKSIPWLLQVFEKSDAMYQQVGRCLSKVSKELGVEPREVEDTRFGKVKAYHRSAIDEFQKRLRMEPSLLVKYRKEMAA